MGKCEHGLTSRECYVCASPKHGEQRKPEALRLADALTAQVEIGGGDLTELEEAAAELRRLHAENEKLRKQHLEAHRNSSTIFAALVEISLLTHLGGEVAEYGDVIDAVRRLHAVNAELLEALKLAVRQNEHDMLMTGEELRNSRAAIARAEGEPK